MIVNHTHKFIFLRTEKTAGSSLSQALKDMGGPDDFAADMSRPAWSKFSPIHHGSLKRKLPSKFGLHVHATAASARHVLGAEVFDSYHKFAVERNPWDRQVSLYMHRCWKTGRTPNFDRDIRSLIYRSTEHVRLQNWKVYSIDDTFIADQILHYETFEEDLAKLWAAIGIEPLELPRKRSEYRDERPHYSTFYTDASRELVGRWYAKEIEALGYWFEEPAA
ncbi:MAG: sulfotransferase family 2 domain-containing protein [Parvularculaceae bacterium]|nr:sulfotransferase family 2 domain-containing protein [Parvularculaceae bacterium]